MKEVVMEKQCRWCGAAPSYHGGHGRPVRYHGWFRYRCGARWHPEHGWARDLGGKCVATIYKRALLFIVKTRAYDIKAARRVARKAIKEGDAW